MTDAANAGAANTSANASNAAAASSDAATANQGTEQANNQQPASNILADSKADDSAEGTETDANKTGTEGDDAEGDGKEGDGSGEGGDEAPADYNYTLPEGFEPVPELQDKLTDFAKANNIPPEKAQELSDLGVQLGQVLAQKNMQAWVDLNKQWDSEVRADPEIGGKNFGKMQSDIAKTLDTFGDKTTRDAFILTGAGNNPAIIKYLYKMANALTEGGAPATGGSAGNASKSIGATLYPNMKNT